MFTRHDLKTAFRQAGLAKGDLVLVHSSLRALGPVEGGADTVIDVLLEILGPEGTLAMPTHTFRVVNDKQPVFHQLLTPSGVGTLSNVFRARAGVKRGLHPTHSVAAIGPLAEKLLGGHEMESTPCSAESPYWRLREWGGKILMIGVGLNCCTFFHACEESAGLKQVQGVNDCKLFSITAENSIIPVSTRPHVIKTWDQYPRLEADLVLIGALSLAYLGTCALRLLDARAAADWLVPRLRDDPSLILPPLTKLP